MSSARLRIIPNKCATLRTETHCKEKRWIVNPMPYIKLQSEDIGARDVSQSYKYPGIEIGVRQQPASIRDEIQKSLHSISRASIKPCQRLNILKVHLLPSLVHKHTFDEVTLGSLNSADYAIRGVTKHWLHLPKDIPKPFYHAPVKSGGLGILQLRQWVPRLRVRRLTEILLLQVEPRINSDGNLRIPDLLAWEKDQSSLQCHHRL